MGLLIALISLATYPRSYHIDEGLPGRLLRGHDTRQNQSPAVRRGLFTIVIFIIVIGILLAGSHNVGRCLTNLGDDPHLLVFAGERNDCNDDLMSVRELYHRNPLG